MKKLLLFSVMSMLLLGCSSDDDAIPLESFVPGTWKMSNFIIETGYDIDGIKVVDLVQQTNCYQDETITFNQDGTAVVSSNSFLKVGASLVEGTQSEYAYTADCVSDTDTYPVIWSLRGKDLVWREEDGSISAGQYTGGNFISFSIPEGFEILLDDGITIHTEQDVLILYERQ